MIMSKRRTHCGIRAIKCELGAIKAKFGAIIGKFGAINGKIRAINRSALHYNLEKDNLAYPHTYFEGRIYGNRAIINEFRTITCEFRAITELQ